MVHKFKLDSGLTVILEPVEGVVSVSVGLWIKTGSRNEASIQYGYAHFVEHMLFKGTKNYSAEKIARMIDRVGGQHNAATNREYTCYYINVVSDFLELSLDILADMYYDSLFDTAELEKEKNVINEEIMMYEDTPDEFIHDLFMECMYNGHSLAHPILGTTDIISATTRDKLQGFFDEYYTNDNAILVIAGRFAVEDAKALAERYFARNRVSGTRTNVDDKKPERIMSHHVERDLEQLHFCLGTDGISRDDNDRWALYAFSTVLGGNMSSRLFQNIREKHGITYSIYSYHSSYRDSGVYGIYCATAPDKFMKALELIMKECRDIAMDGITSEELDDAKAFMKGNLALSLESVEVRMGQLAKNEITFQRHYNFNEMVSEVDAISSEDISRILDRIFRHRALSIVSVGKMGSKKIKSSELTID